MATATNAFIQWITGLYLAGALTTSFAMNVPAAVGRAETPIDVAVMLLGWSGANLPRIDLVAARPGDASLLAEAWVRFTDDDRIIPIIYICTATTVYRDAARGDYQSLVKLAGILAHERWHLGHGRDETGAYTVQISTMEYLHANSLHLTVVRKAMQSAKQAETSARHRWAAIAF